MATLNRSKPFAHVFYDELGRFFEQDGCYFTASGEEWTDPAGSEPKPAKLAKAKAADAPADDQVAAQMAGA